MAIVVTPEDDKHLDCPVITKLRTVPIDSGTCPTIRWEIRDRAGAPVDLTTYAIDGQVIGRFKNGLGNDRTIHQIIGTFQDAANGIVDITLTSALTEKPGIYTMDIGITDERDAEPGVYDLMIVNKGYLDVERGMFSSDETRHDDIGPPTLSEVRMYLRDTVIENDLLDDVEFDDAEILDCIIRPIRQWNETPPPIAYFTTGDFPFRDHWMKAIVSNLLKSAAFWYERNRLPASHGGITVDDRNKANPYLQIALALSQEWKDFILSKKASLNAGLAYGTVNSNYGF